VTATETGLRCYTCSRTLPDDAYRIDARCLKRRRRAYSCNECEAKERAQVVVKEGEGDYTRWAIDDDGVPYRLKG
jgi:hypothetical protein